MFCGDDLLVVLVQLWETTDFEYHFVLNQLTAFCSWRRAVTVPGFKSCALACTHASRRSLDHCHSQHNGPDREYAVEPREGVVEPHSTDINALSQRAPNFLLSSHTSDSCSHVTTTLSFLTGEERDTKRRHSVGFSSDKGSGSVSSWLQHGSYFDPRQDYLSSSNRIKDV